LGVKSLRLGGRRISLAAIDLAAVPQAEDQHGEYVVADLIDEAVVSGPDTPFTGSAH
jgi:hypothetical protein